LVGEDAQRRRGTGDADAQSLEARALGYAAQGWGLRDGCLLLGDRFGCWNKGGRSGTLSSLCRRVLAINGRFAIA
jgi:hypothetical protein